MLVSTYAYVNPLVAIILGSLLAGEELTTRILLAAVFILGSVVVITMKQPASMKSKSIQNLPPSAGND
jgi:drug/metabolite transporter (DMT)-like permease